MKLERRFGFWTATALIIGQVIAVGIFLTPAGMAKSVQSPFWLLVIWVVIGAATLAGALSYSELSARYPEAGGPFVFLKHGYGPAVAFLYGWVVLLVIDPGLTAAFAVGLTGYFAYVVPVSGAGQAALAIALVVLVGFVNILGARIGAGLLKALIAVKVGVLLFLVTFGFGGRFGEWSNFEPFFKSPDDWSAALIGGAVGAYFAFAGWWDVTRVAGEVQEPKRNLPRALVISIGAITAIYILTSAVFFYLVPVGQVKDETTFAAQAGEALFGHLGGSIFAVIVVISVLGTLFAYLMSAPRVYYAMARHGLFFKTFGEPHKRWGTPHKAILIQMTLASMLIASGSFNEIVSYFFLAAIAFPALAVAGLFRMQKLEHSGYRTPFFPLTPILFLCVTAFVCGMIVMRGPYQSLIGTAVVAAGIPVYLLVFKKHSDGN